MTIVIAGAGIAGLTAALSLNQIGADVVVVESVADVKPLGVGINILPHAVRELIELGLEDEMARAGVATASLAYYSKHGQEIWREPRGRLAGYRWPQYSAHRGTLQTLLLNAARARLGSNRVLSGAAIEAFAESAGGLSLTIRNRQTGSPSRLDARLLIGADGIHSAVRAQLYPEEGAPIWNGAILWRGVTKAAGFLDGQTMIMAGHERQKFVAYPIVPDGQGEPVVNWIAERKFPVDHGWRREDWNRPGQLDDFLPAFSDWRFGWIDAPAVISAATGCYEYPMVDRDPLPRWSFGRVTLIGDAAHPMYPIGSNGASQAIIDARVLAREIRDRGASAEALSAYEAERLPATSAIVLANRRNGPEQVMQLVEERAPDGFSNIHDVLRPDELDVVVQGYKRIAGFSIAELNARPPIL